MTLPGMEKAKARDSIRYLKRWFINKAEEQGEGKLENLLLEFRPYALRQWGLSEEGYKKFCEAVQSGAGGVRQSEGRKDEG